MMWQWSYYRESMKRRNPFLPEKRHPHAIQDARKWPKRYWDDSTSFYPLPPGSCASPPPLHPRWIPQLPRAPPPMPVSHARRRPRCRPCFLPARPPLPALARQTLCTRSCELIGPVLAALLSPNPLQPVPKPDLSPNPLQPYSSPTPRSPGLTWLVFATMNPLRPPSSLHSPLGRAGKSRGALAALTTRSASAFVVASAIPAHGSTSAAINPDGLAAASSPPIKPLVFQEWWKSSSQMGSSEGYVYLTWDV